MSTRTAGDGRVPRAKLPGDGVPSPRRPEIDLLRVIALLCVFAIHAAEPFNPWDEWHVRSPERSSSNGSAARAGAERCRRSPRCALCLEGSYCSYSPPLVLVPGMDGTGRLFYRQVPLLVEDYRVATYALRDSAPSMGVLVEDLAGVVRAMSATSEPAVIVGESFGGTLAMSFAVAHPELVRALIVINSFPHFRPQYRLRLAIAGLSVMP